MRIKGDDPPMKRIHLIEGLVDGGGDGPLATKAASFIPRSCDCRGGGGENSGVGKQGSNTPILPVVVSRKSG